jgi:hypothetical protein
MSGVTGGSTGVIARDYAQTIGISGMTGAIGIMTTTTAGRGPSGPCRTCRAEAVYPAVKRHVVSARGGHNAWPSCQLSQAPPATRLAPSTAAYS